MLKKTLRRILKRLLKPEGSPEANQSVEQLGLSMHYRLLRSRGEGPLSFRDVGFRCHSQHEEDGILLYIFSLIGTSNKQCVEICAGDGIECNTANLIKNHRWVGLLVDGDAELVSRANEFYSECADTRIYTPKIVQHWITPANVNELIKSNGFEGAIDLLSLDVDGIDYWLLDALQVIQPRVVVLEFNHLWGPEESVTVPNDPDFTCELTEHGSDYAGASLAAFVKLGRKKGYRLVGTNAFATNAFFVSNDIHCEWLPEIDPAECFDHPRAKFGMQERWPKVRDREWVHV